MAPGGIQMVHPLFPQRLGYVWRTFRNLQILPSPHLHIVESSLTILFFLDDTGLN